MKTCSRVSFAAGTLLLALCVSGCGTVPDEARTLAVGTLRLRADTGPIGLTVIRSGPQFSIVLPANRQEAAHLTSAEAAKATAGSEMSILFPAAYVLGGFEGLLAGTSDPELQRMRAMIEAALREFPSATHVVGSLRQQLTPLGPDQINALADNLPLDPVPPKGKARRPALHPLHESAIEILIGIRTSFLGLQIYTPPDLRSTGDFNQLRHEHNPLLSLVWAVDVMALRPRDWTAAGGVTARYESIPRRFRDWAADDARPLRAELQVALSFIQRQIAHRITVEPATRTQSGDRPTIRPSTPP